MTGFGTEERIVKEMKSNQTPMYKMDEHSNDVISEDGRQNKNHKIFSKFTYEIPPNEKQKGKNEKKIAKIQKKRKKKEKENEKNIEG